MSDAATLTPTDSAPSAPSSLSDANDAAPDEEALVDRARDAISGCNWTIGQCAAVWTERYAAGRTDADFGERVGLSGDQIYQRRRVWETFADVRGEYEALRWSHFYAAVAWDDAPDALGWAEEMGATVAEMRAWRRGQRGEDLTQPPQPDELPPFEATSTLSPTTLHIDSFDESDEAGSPSGSGSGSRSDDANLAVARQTGESEYAPFGKDARGEGATATAEDDKPLRPLAEFKKAAKTMERLAEQLSPELLATFFEVPGDVQDRVLEAFDAVEAKVSSLR